MDARWRTRSHRRGLSVLPRSLCSARRGGRRAGCCRTSESHAWQFVTCSSDDLVQTMRHGARSAVGLAAPQIGVSLRIFVMQERLDNGRDKLYVCIDPAIVQWAGRTSFSEGCLSFPDAAYVRTERAERITLAWTDRKGARQEKKLVGLLAVCAQHELDHLDGKLMVDYGELQGV